MNQLYNLYMDTRTMTGRCLLLSKRNPDTFLTSIITPILMMLLFTYVIGGAVNVGNTSYVNYIVPGIILQCLGQCASTTAISVCTDRKNGIIDRFCTMPIRKSSILTGHVMEAFIRNALTTFLVIIVAFMAGFRPRAQISGWFIVFLILCLYIFTMSWISVYFGILANSPEGAGAFSVIALALPYLSSGFVPVHTMPKALQVFARNQPMTPIIDTVRAALLGEVLDRHTFITAILWCLALLVIFYFLSVRAFRNKTLK